MPPIPLTLYIPPVTGGRLYRSADGRFYAHYDKWGKRWTCHDMTKQLAEGDYTPAPLVTAKTRAKLEEKLGELLPTLPKPAVVRFLRADGTVGMEKPVYPFEPAYGAEQQCVELCGLKPVFRQGGIAVVSQSRELTNALAPGSIVYLVWTMRIGREGGHFSGKERWHAYFGKSVEEPLFNAGYHSFDEEKLATPPVYA